MENPVHLVAIHPLDKLGTVFTVHGWHGQVSPGDLIEINSQTFKVKGEARLRLTEKPRESLRDIVLDFSYSTDLSKLIGHEVNFHAQVKS
ncbi:hypothetical protein DX908_03800 [Parvularcula marina]|uniref:Uncharacterized protein n=1 Tax=Parvularcula marina TaxID=2292771 RepID=A0A371RGE0_9PROT|nr:hypothetical protein DX908_03800 [Parvularcula marina]